MCMQCAAAATVAVGSASGIRAWLRGRLPDVWLRRATAALIGVAILASGIAIGG
jgi:hypothetical protein